MSILVAFNLFVLPFLKKISGCNNPHPQQSVVKAKVSRHKLGIVWCRLPSYHCPLSGWPIKRFRKIGRTD